VYFERPELSRLAKILQGPSSDGEGTAESGGKNGDRAESAATPAPAESPASAGNSGSSGDPRLAALDANLPPPSTDFVKTRLWREAQAKIQSLNPYESFMIYLKAALVVGAVVASPYIFFQIWSFVAAGLYPHEKGYVYIFLPISLGLFLAGASLAFFFVFGPVLEFLFSYNRSMNIAPDMRISDIISFVLLLPLGFGVSFQLPLIMLFLNRIGVLSLDAFVGKWRIAILAIFVISMVLTPSGDPISMSMMAIPLTGLYFFGLAMIKWMPRSRNPFGEAYEP
jgi:sec-independent protein translocase protein TatC